MHSEVSWDKRGFPVRLLPFGGYGELRAAQTAHVHSSLGAKTQQKGDGEKNGSAVRCTQCAATVFCILGCSYTFCAHGCGCTFHILGCGCTFLILGCSYIFCTRGCGYTFCIHGCGYRWGHFRILCCLGIQRCLELRSCVGICGCLRT